MLSKRMAGLALAGSLVIGGAVAGPVSAAPAQAASVAPVVAAISKPKIKTNLPVRRIVTVGKTATFKVKASGSKLKYQWYRGEFDAFRWKTTWTRVAGKAGKRASLKVKATLGKTGSFYRVVVSNAKGHQTSKTSRLLVRPTLKSSFRWDADVQTAHWQWSNFAWEPREVAPGRSVVDLNLDYFSPLSGTRNPKGNLTIAFRANNGRVYADEYANLFGSGTGTIGPVKKRQLGDGNKFVSASATVPTSLVKGGRWIVKDKASPAMTIYIKLP